MLKAKTNRFFRIMDKTARTFKDEDLVVKLRKKPEGVEE